MECSAAFFEVTVISAEELRHAKRNAFVTVRAGHDNYATTSLDAAGGSFPRWGERFRLALPPSSRSISVEVRRKTGAGAMPVAAATIPVSDFRGGAVPAGYLHFLSYRLWDRHGERNGIVNLSIRMEVPDGRGAPKYVAREPAWSSERNQGGGNVVLGIPLTMGLGCRV